MMLEPGMKVEGVRFAVRDVSTDTIRSGKNAGQAYLRGRMGRADLPTDIAFVVWCATQEQVEQVRVGTVLAFYGTVSEYSGELQVTADRGQDVAIVPADEVDPLEFLPSGPWDRQALCKRLDELLESVRDPDLRRLLDHLFADDDFKKAFAKAPAAKSVHHAWPGGLIQHILEITDILETMCRVYPWSEILNRDLLVTGAILHDLEKMTELDMTTTIKYSNMGRWFGHVDLALRRLDRLQEEVKLPQPLYLELRQMVASHHGKLDWGASAKPATPNAWALHLADQVSAKMTAVWQAVNQALASGVPADGWTEPVWALDNTALYLGWMQSGETEEVF